MKYFFIFFIFINGINTYSQNNKTTVLGKIVDNDGIPINNVNITNLNNNTGTITNSKGYFYLDVVNYPIRLEVSRIGFQKKKVKITKDEYENIKTFLIIKLKKTIYSLEEVEIIDEKSDIVAKNNNNWFILDYKISEDKAIVLFKKFNKRKIKVIDINTWSFTEMPIKVKGNKLFKDCIGNIHLLTDDSVYQIQFIDTTLHFYKAYSKIKFTKTLYKCVGCINNSIIFKSVSKHNQEIKYWYVSDKKRQIMYNVYDEKRFLFAQHFLNRINELKKKYGVIDEMGDITVKQLDILRKIRQLEYGYKLIGKIPAYNPIFINNDTVVIFDYVNKSIVYFDSTFSFVKKVPILYPINNSNKIYLDKITGKFYIGSNRLVKNEFQEIDLNTGKTSKDIRITDCVFPEKVIFYGNKIFYIKNVSNNNFLKFILIN